MDDIQDELIKMLYSILFSALFKKYIDKVKKIKKTN